MMAPSVERQNQILYRSDFCESEINLRSLRQMSLRCNSRGPDGFGDPDPLSQERRARRNVYLPNMREAGRQRWSLLGPYFRLNVVGSRARPAPSPAVRAAATVVFNEHGRSVAMRLRMDRQGLLISDCRVRVGECFVHCRASDV